MSKIKIIILVVLLSCLGSQPSFSTPYDGIWFLGFNLNQSLFSGNFGLQLRKAISYQIDRNEINRALFDEIPPSYPLIPFPEHAFDQSGDPKEVMSFQPQKAKRIITKIINTSSLKKKMKKIKILHTDGFQTLQVMLMVKHQLKTLGIELISQEISMYPQENWEKKLRAGNYHLFLMGYKANRYPKLNSLACPLLSSQSSANFTGYINFALDEFCASGKQVNSMMIATINKELPLLPLFYIEKFKDKSIE